MVAEGAPLRPPRTSRDKPLRASSRFAAAIDGIAELVDLLMRVTHINPPAGLAPSKSTTRCSSEVGDPCRVQPQSPGGLMGRKPLIHRPIGSNCTSHRDCWPRRGGSQRVPGRCWTPVPPGLPQPDNGPRGDSLRLQPSRFCTCSMSASARRHQAVRSRLSSSGSSS